MSDEIIYGSDEHPVPEGPLQRIIEFVGGAAVAGIIQIGIPASPSGLYGMLSFNNLTTNNPDEEGVVHKGWAIGQNDGLVVFFNMGTTLARRCSPNIFGGGDSNPDHLEVTEVYIPTPEQWRNIDTWYMGTGTSGGGVYSTKKTVLINFERMRKIHRYRKENPVPIQFGNSNIGVGRAGFIFKAWKGRGQWQRVGDDDVQWASDADPSLILHHRRRFPSTIGPIVNAAYDLKKVVNYSPPVEKAGGGGT